MADWRPTARRGLLAQRAAALQQARHFFAERNVLEVDTPVVVNSPVSDVHLQSAEVRFADAAGTWFLHTSPEYAMKRLLAAGSGDIFQICHVVRGMERGRIHNAEFTLIEWYRLGFSLGQLMEEVALLVGTLLGARGGQLRAEHVTYRDAFVQHLGLDPFTASDQELATTAAGVGFDSAAARDELLDLLMGSLVGPRLGRSALTFVTHYPATQAALARLDPEDPRTALRFELYCDGIELANGFQELALASEQRQRFEQDNRERRRLGLPVHPIDERFLAALQAGMPECSGVALGFDRTLMLAAGVDCIDDVLAFPTDRA